MKGVVIFKLSTNTTVQLNNIILFDNCNHVFVTIEEEKNGPSFSFLFLFGLDHNEIAGLCAFLILIGQR